MTTHSNTDIDRKIMLCNCDGWHVSGVPDGEGSYYSIDINDELEALISTKIVEAKKKAFKNGYNSGWSTRNYSKPRQVICPICKQVSAELKGDI